MSKEIVWRDGQYKRKNVDDMYWKTQRRKPRTETTTVGIIGYPDDFTNRHEEKVMSFIYSKDEHTRRR